MRLALTTPFDAHHTLFIVDRRNSLNLRADLLARLLYPDVARRGDSLETSPSSTGGGRQSC